MTETKSTHTRKAARKPRVPKVAPSAGQVARYHYHQDRNAGTFVVHQKVEVGGKLVAMETQENEYASRDEMGKAVSDWLVANDHAFDILSSTKHCN